MNTPLHKVSVHPFNGFMVYATDEAIRREVGAIRASGVTVKDGEFFVAQYNSPWALFRHNEIWVPAT